MKTLLKFAACLCAGVVVATLVSYPIMVTAFGADALGRLPWWIPLVWIFPGAAIGGWLGYPSDAFFKKFLHFEDRGSFTLNGFGTTFYGRRDLRADGSYITTEWVVALYVPLLPIRSLRVRYAGPSKRRFRFGFGSSESYTVYEKRFPPNWRQVLFTYGYIALLTLWIYFVVSSVLSHFPHAFDTAHGVVLVAVACMVPIPTPWILQYYAEKKV